MVGGQKCFFLLVDHADQYGITRMLSHDSMSCRRYSPLAYVLDRDGMNDWTTHH
jgi:hypothetical protein